MPEASVYEDHFVLRPENQIRASGEVGSMEPEAEAHPMNDTSYDTFGLGIAASNPRHELGSFLCGQMVHLGYLCMLATAVLPVEMCAELRGKPITD